MTKFDQKFKIIMESINVDDIITNVNMNSRYQFDCGQFIGDTLVLEFYGKAYGDGYDFFEQYQNGNFIRGKRSNEKYSQNYYPIFDKQALFIWNHYKIKNIKIQGYFD